MEVSEFRTRLTALANDPVVKLDTIEDFIYDFFSTKPLPRVDSLHKFVVRASLTDHGKPFSNVSRCSYNPIADSITLQRCNYPGQQIFYAALPSKDDYIDAANVAILEVAMKYIKQEDIKEHFLTISRWGLKRKLRVAMLPFVKKYSTFNKDLSDSVQLYLNIFRQSFAPQYQYAVDYFIESLECMSDYLCEVESSTCESRELIYRITAPFVNAVWRYSNINHHGLEGLVYASANTHARGQNIVIKKELVDSGIVFCDYVQMFKFSRDWNNPKSITFDAISNGVEPDEAGNFKLYPDW